MSVSSDSKRQGAGRPTGKWPAGALLTLALCLNLAGCHSYRGGAPAGRQYAQPGRYQAGGNNPNLIFDTPSYRTSGGCAVSSEQFIREPWPSATAETSYYSYPTVIAYEVDVYDDQRISSNNQPYQNFHHRLRGSRVGMTVR